MMNVITDTVMLIVCEKLRQGLKEEWARLKTPRPESQVKTRHSCGEKYGRPIDDKTIAANRQRSEKVPVPL